MTTLQKTTLIALIAVLGGGGIYQAHKALQRHNPVQLTQPSQESKETKEAKKYAGVMAGMASLFFKNGDNIILTNMNQFRKLPPGAVWSDLALNLDKFEIVSNAAPVKWTYPDVVLLRERTPRRTEDGKWARVYGMVDGQALEQISEDGNFDTWEKQHLMPPPNNP